MSFVGLYIDFRGDEKAMSCEELASYLNQQVVMDTKSQYLYFGTLVEQGEEFFTLKDVDVHDHDESKVSKELYIIESLKYGIKVNRRCVKVVRREVISISLLADVVEY